MDAGGALAQSAPVMIKRLTLTTRIMVLVLAVQLACLAGLAMAGISNARAAVRAELRAGVDTARSLVLATIGTLQTAVPADRLMAALPERMTDPRHARISVLDARDGALRAATRPPAIAETAPDWITRLIAPPMQETRLPVVLDGRMLGYVFISPDLQSETAEVWRDLRSTLGLTALASAAQLALIWAVLTHGLGPLGAISARLADLTRGDLGARVGPVGVPDLEPLSRRVDLLGGALQTAQADRDRLSRQVVTRGDQERKAIARDLHDEYGPCLFGLRVEAEAIREASADPAIRAHADNIETIAAEISRVNAALLADLRPMPVGQLPLGTVLADHVEDLRRRFPGMAVELDLPPDLTEPDEATALTLFRIVQEGITNALRHSGGDRVAVRLWTGPGDWQISIADNGTGIAPGRPEGRGLSGMRERITLLGGRMDIGSGKDGTEIRATLPRAELGETET